MNTHLWYYFLTDATALEQQTLDKFRRAGLTISQFNAAVRDGIGIVLFDAPKEELELLLLELTRNGSARVMALASSREALRACAWELLQAGASDVLVWSNTDEQARAVAAQIERWVEVDRIAESEMVGENLVGESRAWRATLRRVIEVARFSDSPVLLVGETGTGKELVARLIHTLDPRTDKRELVTLDCSTVVSELAGSEFFGHERGAFTSAFAAREGAFALADGGTLFLDEVGELPARLQAELLRVVQERTYKRVGSNLWQTTNFRLISATNRDIEKDDGLRFRRDLYYRLASWTCRLPPLRERMEDVLPLARHFMKQLRPGEPPVEMDEPVRDYLLQRNYPGNVRELKQLMTRIMARHVGRGPVTVGDIAEEERPEAGSRRRDWRDEYFENAIMRALSLGLRLKEITSAAADTAIRLAIKQEAGRGRLKRAASRLGVTERALQLRGALSRDGKKATAKATG